MKFSFKLANISRSYDECSRGPDTVVQEAQLSQRDRATLRVIEYFAKSLKVIRNDTVEHGVCKTLLLFH